MDSQELVSKYNKVMDKIDYSLSPSQNLKNLSNADMFWFIAGKTYAYGRSVQNSIANAKAQMENPREELIKRFAYKDKE